MRIPKSLKELKVSAWLGWQVESNWTNPFVFSIYIIIKPIAAVLILVFMYLVVLGANTRTPLFGYIYVGNVFFMYISMVLFGIGWTIIDDREHYEMLKYIYTSPLRIYTYLVGRGTTKTLLATVAVVIALVFGVLVFKLPIGLGSINYPYLLVALVLGLLSVFVLGIILAGVILIVPRHTYMVNEGVAGVIFLLCGAIFPLEMLPRWVQPVGKLLPFTYWLEGMRRALIGGSISTAMAGYSDGVILLILLATTVGLVLVSDRAFRLFEHFARRKGYIDRTTGY